MGRSRGDAAACSAAASSRSTSPTRRSRGSSPSGRRCRATTTARARTSSRSRTAATSWPSTTSSARRTARRPTAGGGFALYDVSDPANPTKLVDAAGDYGRRGELVCCDADAPGADDAIAHEYHSVFMWRDDGRVYLIGVDNDEQAQTDVDIFDITDPSAPVAVREYDLDDGVPAILDGEEDGLGDNVLLHDMVVKEIDGVQTLLASYWDGGYVLAERRGSGGRHLHRRHALRRHGPADRHDAARGQRPPGGVLARQRVHPGRGRGLRRLSLPRPWSTRAPRTSPSSATSASPSTTAAPPVGPQISAERSLTGDTRYVGNGCNAATIPPATAGVTIAIVNAFGCAFRDKTDNAEARGYQRARSSSLPATPRRPTRLDVRRDHSTSAATTTTPAMSSRCGCTREVGFAHDGSRRGLPVRRREPDADADGAAVEGVPVDIGAQFDGWGYAHLYRNGSGKLDEVGTPYAIPEGIDERYADRLRRPLDPRVRDRPGRRTSPTRPTTPAACASLSFGDAGHRGGRPLHRRRRQQLLGRRAVHAATASG